LGYWALDDTGSVCVDGSSNGNNGTIIGTGLTSVAGVVGKCLEFPGNSTTRVMLSTPISLAEDTAWSISYWAEQDVVNKATLGEYNTAYNRIYHMITALRMHFADTTYVDLSHGTELSGDGIKHHFVIICDGTDENNITYYRDGVLRDTETKALSAFVIDCIGYPNTDTANAWDGKIDEVRIYNKALSASEVKALYLSPGGVRTTKINGGAISVDTSVAIGSTVYGANGIQLQYNAGHPRLYCGDGANNYINFNGTNVTMSSDATTAILIKSGGDIVLEGNDATPGELIFKGTTRSVVFGTTTTGNLLYIRPTTYGGAQLGLGGLASRFGGFLMTTDGIMRLLNMDSPASQFAYVFSEGSSRRIALHVGYDYFDVLATYCSVQLQLPDKVTRRFFPNPDSAVDLGWSFSRWNDLYYDTAYEHCSLLDNVDDLAIISNIKPLEVDGKVQYDKAGNPLMDIFSLPDMMTNINKLAKELTSESGTTITATDIKEIKNGAKPALKYKTKDSEHKSIDYTFDKKEAIRRTFRNGVMYKDLGIGAIKKLTSKVASLEAEIKSLKTKFNT
jgi:hypothetical protein